MKNVSDKYSQKMQDTLRTFIPRMSIGGVELDGDIQSGMTISLGSCGSEQFAIGNAYIPYITASITDCSVKLQDKEILLEMGLVMDDETVEYTKVGYFTVEKPSTDKFQTSFTAYGRLMSKAGNLYTSELTYPATIAAVLNEISSKSGLNIVLKNLTASGTINKPITGEMYREALMRIAGLLGGFVTEDGDGNIVISKYTINKAVTVSTDFCYSYPETTDSEYEVTGIEVIVSEDTTDEEGNTIAGEKYTSDSVVNISIQNPYMTEALFETCETNIVGFSYMPAKVEFLGDVRLEPWDSIVLSDEAGVDVPCMSITHVWDGGLVTTVSAPGQTATEKASSFGGLLSSIVEKTYQKMLAAEKIIAKKITADEIITDDIKATTGSFTKYLTGVRIVGDLIEAATIKTESLILKGKDGIFRRLNMDSLGEAVVDSAPETYYEKLDGSVLVAESVTAEKINVEDLFAKDITATGDFKLGGKGALSYDSKTGEVSIRAKSLTIGNEEVPSMDDIGTSLYIESSNGTLFKNDSIETELSVVIYRGSQRITDMNTLRTAMGQDVYLQWKWQQLGEVSYKTIPANDPRLSNDGFKFTLSPEDVDTKVTFICELNE